MKIKHGYVLRKVAGENIVVPTEEAALNFNGILTLNETGKVLWEMLQTGASEGQLVDVLVDRYEVDEDTAMKDVADFIRILKGKNILDE